MKKLIIAFSSIVGFFSISVYANPPHENSCVADKILAYRAEMGEQAMIRMDMLGEFEEMCGLANSFYEEDESHDTLGLEVWTDYKYNPLMQSNMRVIEFRAVVDSITVYELEINRGNCRINNDRFPFTLNFGETGWLVIGCNPQDVLEANISASTGDWTVSFR